MRVEGQASRVEGQKRRIALRANSGSRLLTLDSRPSRRGITLIELLIAILIITILAGLVLGVASVAAETAREAQSRHIVERLHTLLMEYYDTYKTRRMKLNPNIEQTIRDPKSNLTSAQQGQALAEARLYALREMMLMEVPDRWSDVLLSDVGSTSPNNSPRMPVYLDPTGTSNGRTALANVYLRRYLSLIGRTNSVTGQLNTAADLKTNQSAECLYMVITLACGDGEAKTLFKENEIGDTDGDGAPEFLDGWKHPISFLRWAPGFDSQIQLNMNTLKSMSPTDANLAVAKDHDPFDLYRRDISAFRLVPLIYSAGRDETLGIYDAPDFVTWNTISTPNVTVTPSPSNSQYIGPALNPYKTADSMVESPSPNYLGTALDGTATDNVHNHLLGKR